MPTDDATGVYGLRFAGLPLGPAVPAGAPAHWPLVELLHRPQRPAPTGRRVIGADRATLELLDDLRTLTIDREPARATFLGPPLPPDDLAHPYLGPIATVFARWLGGEAFHGGAFLTGDGRAIAVLGSKEAGKSTLLAAMAAAGIPVVADDMLVIHGGRVCRGPRTVDLRAAPRADLRGDLVVSRARGDSRWRLALPPIAADVELAGWVFLSAADAFALEPVGLAERLGRLVRWRAWQELPSDPQALLALAALPTWTLQRPRTWEALPATIDALLGLMPPSPAANAARPPAEASTTGPAR